MWSVDGRTRDPGFFAGLVPEQVLYDFDGPRIFTSRTAEGGLVLACLCEQEGKLDRFVVAPANEREIEQLQSGSLPVRDALTRGWLWIVDRNHRGSVKAAWECSPSSLPNDVLPKPGTPLLPSHELTSTLKSIAPERRKKFEQAQARVRTKGLWAA